MRYRYCLMITTMLSLAPYEGAQVSDVLAAPSGSIDLGNGVVFDAGTKEQTDAAPVPVGTLGTQTTVPEFKWQALGPRTYNNTGASAPPLNADVQKGGINAPPPPPPPAPSPGPSPAPSPFPILF